MVGPVFSMEILTGSRRGKLAWILRAYAGWLIVQFFFFHIDHRYHNYLELLVGQHFLFMLLLTPPFVAGAISNDKECGTLLQLLTTSLTAWDIVVGKLLGRLAQLAFIALASLPLFAFAAGYSEIPLLCVLAVAVVSVVPFLALGAVSALASVWSTQTRSAVLCVYLFIALGWIVALPQRGLGLMLERLTGASPGADLRRCLDPLHVLDAVWTNYNPDLLVHRLSLNCAGWGSIVALCVPLAVWRLRPAYQRQLQQTKSRRGVLRARAPVGDEPILWKERDVDGVAFTPLLRRIPFGLAMSLTVVGSSLISVSIQDFYLQGLAVVLLASLIIGVRASNAVCGEREQRTWDALMQTPLEAKEILHQKHRGILLAALPYLIAYGTPVVCLSALHPMPGSFVISVVSFGCAWIAMEFMAAVGIGFSVRSRSSWRSLLGTLAFGYPTALFLFLLGMLLFVFVTACVFGTIATMLIDKSEHALYVAVYLVLPALFLGCQLLAFRAMTRGGLEDAALDVERRDRNQSLRKNQNLRFRI